MLGSMASFMETELMEYGLSEKEAQIYIACLKTGPSTANRISSATDLRRATTYDILESLKAKGLMGSFIRDKKNYFQATEPITLLKRMQEKEQRIKGIIPLLERMKGIATEKPHVELFEGVRGVTMLFEELYKEKALVLYGSAEKAHLALKHVPESLAVRRAELGITLRAVMEKSPYATFRIKDPHIRKVTQMRFLNTMKYFPTVTFIAGNKVGKIGR